MTEGVGASGSTPSRDADTEFTVGVTGVTSPS